MADSEHELVERIKSRGNIPHHVGIIMDGNGRWAEKQGLARTEGHKAGIVTVREIVQAAGEINIAVLTLYTFSHENWKRPQSEVSALMTLLLQTIRKEIDDLDKKNVRLTSIGDINALPYAPRTAIKSTIKRLQKNTGLILNLALSYSSRMEIVGAVKQIGREVLSGKIDPETIDEQLFSRYLQTADLGDPDLIIRTGGEKRISNFLLWQIAYSELYITPTLWPDFRTQEFYQAVEEYQQRERRFGKVSRQL